MSVCSSSCETRACVPPAFGQPGEASVAHLVSPSLCGSALLQCCRVARARRHRAEIDQSARCLNGKKTLGRTDEETLRESKMIRRDGNGPSCRNRLHDNRYGRWRRQRWRARRNLDLDLKRTKDRHDDGGTERRRHLLRTLFPGHARATIDELGPLWAGWVIGGGGAVGAIGGQVGAPSHTILVACSAT